MVASQEHDLGTVDAATKRCLVRWFFSQDTQSTPERLTGVAFYHRLPIKSPLPRRFHSYCDGVRFPCLERVSFYS